VSGSRTLAAVPNRVRALVVLAALLGLAGCTSHGSTAVETIKRTTTQTVTTTPTAGAPYTPPPATAVPPLGKSNAPMPAGETEGTCPYISNTDVADAEGDHVYRSSIITTSKPVGCRFYFYSSPYQAIADIVPTTFANATDAHNAMVATAAAGTSGTPPIPVVGLIAGVDAILYKTAFNPNDGNNDWACVFAKDTVMVVVHTQQTNVSFNARAIAAAVAPKF
jgi:hypothetical protein